MPEVVEIRFHGRGGQGIVTASELFVRAAAYDGKVVQSTPFFGAERRGAAVVAYARISDRPIWLREPVYNPDVIVVFDHKALDETNVLGGVKERGKLLVNTPLSIQEVNEKIQNDLDVYVVDATSISTKHLKRPIVNTTMLGALSKVTGLASIDSLRRAISYRFPKIDIQATMAAVEEAANSVDGIYLS